ncbi:MAG TPA: hypothetical protein VGF45_23425, partial [Polyangia bacterium]
MACSATPPASMPRQTGGTSGGSNTGGSGSGNASGGATGTGGVASGSSGGTSGAAGGSTGTGGGGSGTGGAGGSALDARRDDGGTDGSLPSPTPDGGAATRAFVYASGYSAPISIFSFDLATGKLTPNGMATTGTGGEPTSLAFSP